MRIETPETPDAIRRCHPVMHQLRPHVDEATFVAQVQRQMQDGYRLACVIEADAVVAVAGFRMAECLSAGRYLYVDDLVTDDAARSRGHGEALFKWLVAHARAAGCVHLSLDSGVQRTGAHKFYLNRGMRISGYHFALEL